jgi:hypothetical protein
MIIKLTQGWFPIPDQVCADLGITEGTQAELEVFDGGVLVLTLQAGAPKPPPIEPKSKRPR